MPLIYDSPLTFYEEAGYGSPGDESKRRWVLVLNHYQRDNLLWLLNLVGYGAVSDDPADDGVQEKNYGHAGPVKPFDVANNGDWLGEISIMLGQPGFGRGTLDAEKTGKPNSSRRYVINQLATRGIDQ